MGNPGSPNGAVSDPVADDDVDMVHDTRPKRSGPARVTLTELFPDDEDSDDDEFPSSAPVKEQPSSSPAPLPMPT